MSMSDLEKKNRGYENLSQPASFRDPDGYMFVHNGTLYRCVNTSYESNYNKLKKSGLYNILIEKGWLVSHDEIYEIPLPQGCNYILKPERLPFISYPYEWSFGQLQEAALLTLDILSLGLDYGMTLKDATAYNITWHEGKPIFIDTLSFMDYSDGSPWQGYRQFCSHFLAPLALMQHVDLRLQKLLLTCIDGIPLDLASTLLPWRTRMNMGLGIHIHMHARSQRKYASVQKKVSVKVPIKTLRNLIESLRNSVLALTPPVAQTEWGSYYSDTNYTAEQHAEKKEVIAGWLANGRAERVLDLGANDGTFSRVAVQAGSMVIAADIDPMAVQFNYAQCKSDGETRITPLLLDVTNPSPGIGWLCRERSSVFERFQIDLGMALALVHHLAISNNTPLDMILEAFARMAPIWIVEFVRKHDSQVQRLLANREDIFPDYTEEGFEKAATRFFNIESKHTINGMNRILYFLNLKTKDRIK